MTSLTSNVLPKRGEIWLVNFDPTLGAEIKKIRPAVVISSDAIGKLPIKLIAPITDWKSYFASNLWHVKIEPDSHNGLSKVSTVDALQLRGVDTQRFIRKLGCLSEITIEEITIAIAVVIEYQLSDE
ncbi:type II toxin-antitoxin system PemK/MazF family toxin [Chroogloeocystis siderophila]|uniref:type II toxin-antitoxin system PemK/MazF family toxin n=1 Tax=Chroogloeocystis siderophila TaxID=329163 RepID=UPI0026A0A7D0